MYANYETAEGKKVIDWNETEKHAKSLNIDQLRFAIKDCTEAGEAMKDLERGGWFVKKDQGYYHDERSIYSKILQIKLNK